MPDREQYVEYADRSLPGDWDDARSRREQILAVIEYFLATPQEMETRERRLRAQRKAADEFDVTINTVQSKCGRETWGKHVSSSDDYQREHFDRALEEIEAAVRDDTALEMAPSDTPSVWIEKTEIEGRTYKKEGELQLGEAIYSPSQDKQGHDRYAAMREADIGDIVIHLLQDKDQIIGVSTIASELETDFEGLPEFGWTEEQAGYRRLLTGYHELEEPIDVYDEILNNRTYERRLREIREAYSNIFYTKNLSYVQGGYFTQCPPELVGIFAQEGDEIATELEERGYPLDESMGNASDAGEYESTAAAVTDIRERLEVTPRGVTWLTERLGEVLISKWSTALEGFQPEDDISAERAAMFDQLRAVFRDLEPALETKADELGVGTLDRLSPAETLFFGWIRVLQDNLDVEGAPLSHPQFNSILNSTYSTTNQAALESGIDHPLTAYLREAEPTVYKFTAPPDNWLTVYDRAAIGLEEANKNYWETIERGDVLVFHSRSTPARDALADQESGLLGAGIVRTTATKPTGDEWWYDERTEGPKEEAFPYLIAFDRLYTTGVLDAIDFPDPLPATDVTVSNRSLERLTAGLLPFEEADDVAQTAAGSGFPRHQTITQLGEPGDYEKALALLDALAPRLEAVPPVAMHRSFAGTLAPDSILEGLYFPGAQGEEIIAQVEGALRSGKHVIFTGPPGTGKTEIAKRVANQLATDYPYLYSGSQVTTATSDWSTFDTVGGYMPSESAETANGQLEFTPGLVLNRFKSREHTQRNETLVIDELNRADIDKAFGQLFTVLSGQSVTLPYTIDDAEVELSPADGYAQSAAHEYRIPESWRLFATLNTYDKTSLYEMSYAFMRRFAFIRVPAPSLSERDDAALVDLVESYADTWGIDEAAFSVTTQDPFGDVGRVWKAANGAIEDRAIGPAVMKDVLSYLRATRDIRWSRRLTQAVISYIFPQLEGVPKRAQVVRRLADVDAIESDQLDAAARDMLQVSALQTDG